MRSSSRSPAGLPPKASCMLPPPQADYTSTRARPSPSRGAARPRSPGTRRTCGSPPSADARGSFGRWAKSSGRSGAGDTCLALCDGPCHPLPWANGTTATIRSAIAPSTAAEGDGCLWSGRSSSLVVGTLMICQESTSIEQRGNEEKLCQTTT
eukprot:scaffold114_cov361-Pinguiococcus_pyrenoidosus.AAC.6